ncbi:coiled-coil domain-containing protein 85C-like isoform X3 [Varroa jacobsoni]|uniref:coiled-coil domain-containing protein 85C-like isoform X3 n=1 Tax=Varroa jacobsoni TaxID=62625 RepID=UPI000BF901CC|nr:coiled-coil domain-containing protein 85C-like isoform X3 [Varroa jacobsoni]
MWQLAFSFCRVLCMPKTDMASRTHPRGRPSNDELLQRGAREVLGWLERVETQHLHLVVEYNAKMRDMARAVEQHRQEVVQLKESENEELRNMCCFLDDERERAHKLVTEWRRFGRYTASILSHELNSYHTKLNQLESRQNRILSGSGFRWEPTNAKPDLLEATPASTQNQSKDHSDKEDSSSEATSSSATATQTRQAMSSTELTPTISAESVGSGTTQSHESDQRRSIADNVADAFKVLELHEQLECDPMSDREKALIRDMCNVVWNKLEQHYSPTIQQIAASEGDTENQRQPASLAVALESKPTSPVAGVSGT